MDTILEITAMRGYASLGVVFFHLLIIAGLLASTPYSSMILSWNSGVDFFFVLSGFLLAMPFLRAEKLSLKDYYVKRVFRIIPVYYLNLVVIGSIFFLLFKNVTFDQVLASLAFAQSFFPSTFDSINGVNWSLAIEEIFYATLPIFSVFFMRGRWKVALPVCLAIAIVYRLTAIELYANDNLAFHLWQYPSFIGHYALGATLANFYVHNKARAARRYASSLPMLLSIAAVLATQYWIGGTYSAFHDKQALPGMLFALEYVALIYFSITSPATSLVGRLFTNRIATSVGQISYSLYAWHLPIEMLLYRLKLPFMEWAALSVVVAIAVVTASYYFVEKPSLRLRKRLLRREEGRKVTPATRAKPLAPRAASP